jgi:hypothetical protein
MSSGAYPRDLRGYGARPPDPQWPRAARTAVQFVINYEEGAENCVLHGDGASEAFLSEIVGAVAYPGQRHMNMESLYEYGARAGFWRLYRILLRFWGSLSSKIIKSPKRPSTPSLTTWLPITLSATMNLLRPCLAQESMEMLLNTYL